MVHMRIYCETYGCTANKVDAEIMLGLAESSGHEIVNDLSQADVIILNTCAVKGTTYRRMLHRIKLLSERNCSKLIVAGCLPLIDEKAVLKAGKPDAIISCKSISDLPEVLRQLSEGMSDIIRKISSPAEKPLMPKKRMSPISAAIQIAEGCVSNCSYCAVKFARGKLRSFRMKSILEEAKNLVAKGYREILLTAQDVAAYGLDTRESLPRLLEELNLIPGNFRIRVGMMNPANVLPMLGDLVEVFKLEKIYKFLHLPVQSGDDEMLRKMRRNYTVDDFLRIVDRFRREIPDLILSTDIIVGFPGEGEQEFENTKKLIMRTRPDKVNISKFSPMPGTEAAKMKQVDGREICKRSKELHSLCMQIGMENNLKVVGREVDGFVVERGEKSGYILRDASYRQVLLRDAKLGEFLRARIIEARPTYVIGEVIR